MLFVCSRGLCQSVKICSKISFFLMPPPWHWRRSHIVLAWQCLIYSTGRFLCWRRGHQMSRLHFPTSFQLPSSYPTLSYLPCWTLCCCISDRCRTVDFPRQWWQSWNQPGRIAHSWASYKNCDVVFLIPVSIVGLVHALLGVGVYFTPLSTKTIELFGDLDLILFHCLFL